MSRVVRPVQWQPNKSSIIGKCRTTQIDQQVSQVGGALGVMVSLGRCTYGRLGAWSFAEVVAKDRDGDDYHRRGARSNKKGLHVASLGYRRMSRLHHIKV